MNGEPRHVPGRRGTIAAAVRSVLAGGGEPLSAATRADLEPRFGADLSAVRVHADEAAGVSARQLSASAYTAGQHVVFGAGRYAPGTAEGRALLAHEIAHTIQQRHVGPDGHEAAAMVGAVAGPGAESAARHAASQALAGPAPVIASEAPAVAREEGTAEVVDRVPDKPDRVGPVFTSVVRRDQYKTHAEARRAEASKGDPKQQPGYMDTGFATVEMNATTGEVTIPVTVTVRHASDDEVDADARGGYLTSRSAADISAARVKEVGDRFIAEVNAGLNNWFTLYVPPCQGITWSGRELPITVRVTQSSRALDADFDVAVSQHTGRSSVSARGIVMLYAGGGLDTLMMRHEGTHMVLGLPDEYEETDKKLLQDAAARRSEQKSEERVRRDYPLTGDMYDYGNFSMLHERHFSFVPKFAHRVLASLGHPECVPVLHEGSRPRPGMLRASLEMGTANYGSWGLSYDLGVDAGLFLDRERQWRAFLGAHGHLFLGGDRLAFLLGARLAVERKWGFARLGPTAGAYAEGGVATETSIIGPSRGAAPYAGAGASVGIAGWTGFGEWEVKLTGGEVVRLDGEKYHAFQAGIQAGLTWWGGGR